MIHMTFETNLKAAAPGSARGWWQIQAYAGIFAILLFAAGCSKD